MAKGIVYVVGTHTGRPVCSANGIQTTPGRPVVLQPSGFIVSEGSKMASSGEGLGIPFALPPLEEHDAVKQEVPPSPSRASGKGDEQRQPKGKKRGRKKGSKNRTQKAEPHGVTAAGVKITRTRCEYRTPLDFSHTLPSTWWHEYPSLSGGTSVGFKIIYRTAKFSFIFFTYCTVRSDPISNTNHGETPGLLVPS